MLSILFYDVTNETEKKSNEGVVVVLFKPDFHFFVLKLFACVCMCVCVLMCLCAPSVYGLVLA